MLKALAVLRTVFLVFIVGYALRVLPWGWSRTFDEEFARCTATRAIAIQAAWMAIAWIALDTLLSWWLATRAPKLHEEIPRGGEPPFAPPGHRS
ncbi:MAG TPA: hypothetical protein VF912_07340 [Anaeromyxobacter sp.]